MNQITTRYITENGACYEQYVITDPEAKTALTITPERGGMITSFTLDGEEFVWTRRPNFSECNRPRFGVPVLFPSCGNPDNGVHIFDGKAYPMETHGFADLCAWEVDSVGPDGKDHPHPQGGRRQLCPSADRRAVPHDPDRQGQRPQGDRRRR